MRPASKLSFPVSELFLDQGTLQPLALPGGVVSVLNWQFGQRDRVPIAERVVKRRQPLILHRRKSRLLPGRIATETVGRFPRHRRRIFDLFRFNHRHSAFVARFSRQKDCL